VGTIDPAAVYMVGLGFGRMIGRGGSCSAFESSTNRKDAGGEWDGPMGAANVRSEGAKEDGGLQVEGLSWYWKMRELLRAILSETTRSCIE
jgi:hypothetical protein